MNKRNESDPKDCPAWCASGTKEHPCHGEHHAISAGSYILATGGHFDRSEHCDGGRVPTVGVGLYWAEHWGGGQELFVQVGDEWSINLKPAEALALTTEMVIMLQAMVHASGIGIEDGHRVLELVSVAEALKSALVRERVQA